MKIALFASPDFALPSYRALRASRHEVALVVTRPDAPKGRELKTTPTVVAAAAAADGLPVLKPEKLNRAFIEELSAFRVDALAVVAYGRLIGPTLLAAYPGRVLNLHPSLLPRLRGASPIQTAILEGHAESGATIMHLTGDLDAGDLILQRRFSLHPRIDVEELHDRLADLGAGLLVEALDRIEAGDAPRTPQDHGLATFSKPIEKAMGRIDWARGCDEIDRLVRAFHPWPGSYTTLGGAGLRLHRAEPLPDRAGTPGLVLEAGDAGLVVGCGRGALRVLELQPEARRRMDAAAFLRGRPPVTGTQLS